jgi:hypothetical protein
LRTGLAARKFRSSAGQEPQRATNYMYIERSPDESCLGSCIPKAQGAYEHEAKEYDLHLVRQGCA